MDVRPPAHGLQPLMRLQSSNTNQSMESKTKFREAPVLPHQTRLSFATSTAKGTCACMLCQSKMNSAANSSRQMCSDAILHTIHYSALYMQRKKVAPSRVAQNPSKYKNDTSPNDTFTFEIKTTQHHCIGTCQQTSMPQQLCSGILLNALFHATNIMCQCPDLMLTSSHAVMHHARVCHKPIAQLGFYYQAYSCMED
jgi:hypothetical protein